MPFKFGDMCRSGTGDVSSVNGLFSSPITVSVLIVLVMVLLVAFTYKSCECEGKYKNLISFAVYGGILAFAIVFLHNNSLLKLYKSRNLNDDADVLFQGGEEFEKRVNQKVNLSDLPDYSKDSNDSKKGKGKEPESDEEADEESEEDNEDTEFKKFMAEIK